MLFMYFYIFHLGFSFPNKGYRIISRFRNPALIFVRLLIVPIFKYFVFVIKRNRTKYQSFCYSFHLP